MPSPDTTGPEDELKPAAESLSEALSETVGVKVTPSQKRDITMVAALDELDVSSLLRVKSINDILARAVEIRGQHRTALAIEQADGVPA